jgi:acyl-CoA thioesterase
VDTRTFLGVEPTHNRFRWKLPVTMGICTGGNFMFGGAGLGAAIAAMEGTSGRAAIWATAQYLSYARPGEYVDIDVTLAVEGHQMTQARAVCHVADREILTVNAALGNRPFDRTAQFETMPSGVPAPEECPTRIHHSGSVGINTRLDERLAMGRELDALDGTSGDGRTLLWARIPEVLDGVDGAALAVLGDFVPMGVGQGLGIRGGGNSLDNTLRIVEPVPTDWVLLDIRVQAVERGFGHGLVHMFAEDGTLLATASQSCIVRYWRDPARRLDTEP